MPIANLPQPPVRTGWTTWLVLASLAALLFETLTGLAITLAPFHAAVQWSVLLHTAVGAAMLLPRLRYGGGQCDAHASFAADNADADHDPKSPFGLSLSKRRTCSVTAIRGRMVLRQA